MMIRTGQVVTGLDRLGQVGIGYDRPKRANIGHDIFGWVRMGQKGDWVGHARSG